eukprot:TRINITY_DN100222_c0_g1_i1.p2 TRINITY_DN100222_c0_g1~~TRINITY_DN100222_c0_g1_i1.p2  ORF type:complete len:152 (+),score=21.79 TRINITY_DN100222_c0_g1_i1:74-529(+)
MELVQTDSESMEMQESDSMAEDDSPCSRKRAPAIDLPTYSNFAALKDGYSSATDVFENDSMLGILSEGGWDVSGYLQPYKKQRPVAPDGHCALDMLCDVCLAASAGSQEFQCGHRGCSNHACCQRCRRQWQECAHCKRRVCGACVSEGVCC